MTELINIIHIKLDKRVKLIDIFFTQITFYTDPYKRFCSKHKEIDVLLREGYTFCKLLQS